MRRRRRHTAWRTPTRYGKPSTSSWKLSCVQLGHPKIPAVSLSQALATVMRDSLSESAARPGTSALPSVFCPKLRQQSCSRFLWITLLMMGPESVQSKAGRGFRKAACILRSDARARNSCCPAKGTLDGNEAPRGLLLPIPEVAPVGESRFFAARPIELWRLT